MLNTTNLAEIKTSHTPEYVPQSWLGRYWWLAGVFVALVAGVLISLTRFGYYINEDVTLINQLTGDTAGGPFAYFTRDWGLDGNFYAPLPRLFFWLQFQLFHNTAYGWHVFSAVLNTGCAVLVWLLAWRLTRRPAVALVAGLFFAALPAHVPVVGQVSTQADLWAALFCLASAVTFLYARQTVATGVSAGRSSQFYIASIVFYGLALLCKEEAVALPLALLAFDLVTGGLDRIRKQTNPQEDASDRAGTTVSHLFGYYAPYLALLVIYLVIHMAFLGGLSIYTTGGIGQGTGPVDFMKDNARTLAQPFALGGTDGLIQIAALIAFLALTGVQEWEAWLLNNPTRAQVVAEERAVQLNTPELDFDDEMDDPSRPIMALKVEPVSETPQKLEPAPAPVVQPRTVVRPVVNDDWELDDPNAVLARENPVEPAPPLVGEDNRPAAAAVVVNNGVTEVVQTQVGESRPPYWTLRAAIFGFLWAAAFLLPFVTQKMSNGPLYLASAGFVLFMAAALAPFGAAAVHQAADKKQARTLFGHFELSFWLRVAAILVLVGVYFATSVGSINTFNETTKPLGAVLKFFL